MTIDADTPDAGAIDGWNVTAGEIDWIGKYWTASEGSKSIDLNGLKAGADQPDLPDDRQQHVRRVVQARGQPRQRGQSRRRPGRQDDDRRGHRDRGDVLFVQRVGQVARRDGLDGRGLLVRGQGLQHDHHLHLDDPRRLGACRSTTSSSPRPSRPAPAARRAAGRPWSTRTGLRSRTRATASATTRPARRTSQAKQRSQPHQAHHDGPRPASAGGGRSLPG